MSQCLAFSYHLVDYELSLHYLVLVIFLIHLNLPVLRVFAMASCGTKKKKKRQPPNSNLHRMSLFQSDSSVAISGRVAVRPKPGYQYLFQFFSHVDKDDWRADGYRWRQNAKKKFTYGDEEECFRYYFKLQIGPEDFTTEFSKHAIECPLFPDKILVWYEGDDSVVQEFSHGNAKDDERNFTRSAPSLLKKMKEPTEKLPLQVFADLVAQASCEVDRHKVDGPRNIKQVQNALQNVREAVRLSPDSVYNLYELHKETGFVSDIHLAPSLITICYRESMLFF